MHRAPEDRFPVVPALWPWIVAWTLLVVGCGPRLGAVQAPVVASVPGPEIVTAPAAIDPHKTAQDYITAAKRSDSPARDVYLLHAAQKYLDSGDGGTALDTLASVSLRQLAPGQRARHDLLAARADQMVGNHRQALATLLSLSREPDLTPSLRAQILGYRATSEVALGRPEQALRSLSARSALLTSEAELRDQDLQFWRILLSMSRAELTGAMGVTTDPRLRGWIELALINSRYAGQDLSLEQARTHWRLRYPNHPGQRAAPAAPVEQPGVELTQIRQIGLLLPLSSRHRAAARAFYDGFMAARDARRRGTQPQVVLYDIGAQPELTPDYYRTAVDEGADFIVGPLGKDAVEALVGTFQTTTPTLLLSAAEFAVDLPATVYQFGLQPEDEADQAAQRAYADGHRFVGVLFPASDWGQRMREAFADRWESLGGVVVANHTYLASQGDYSQVVRDFLRITEVPVSDSNATTRRFVPRHREDIDSVFIAAKPGDARLIKPQFDFFLAQDLPLYATSHVFSGRVDRFNDTDLDGLIFSDMPWMLKHDDRFDQWRQTLRGDWSGKHTSLDRLYAFGIDAYNLAPQLDYLRRNPGVRIPGVTAVLSVGPDGRIARQATWARFAGGVPTLLGPPTPDRAATQEVDQ